jgi:hypothetical protein
MSATTCSRCSKPLPQNTLRELARGTKCPYCEAPLKRSAPPATGGARDDGYAAFEMSGAAAPAVAVAAAPPLKPGAAAIAKALRQTMVGAAVAPPGLPFDGTAAPVGFALAAPAASAAPARAAAAPAVRASAPAPAARTPARAVNASALPVSRAATLDLPVPTPPPVPRAPATSAPSLVTESSDSEPTHVARPSARRSAAVVPLLVSDASDSEPTHVRPPSADESAAAESELVFPDSEPIAAVTLAPDPEPADAMPADPMPAALSAPVLLAPPRRGLALIGIGMGLAIVTLVGVGIKMLGGPKAKPVAAAPSIAKAPEAPAAPAVVEPVPPPVAPPPAPAPVEAAAPPVKAPPPARASAAPQREARSKASKKSRAHHRRTPRGQKLAMQKPAAKPSAPAPAPVERSDPRPPYERGNALLFAGDGKGAIAAYREAVKSAPSDPIGFRGLGLAYEQQGETAAARRAFKRYLKLAPNAPDRAIIQRRIDRLGQAKQK